MNSCRAKVIEQERLEEEERRKRMRPVGNFSQTFHLIFSIFQEGVLVLPPREDLISGHKVVNPLAEAERLHKEKLERLRRDAEVSTLDYAKLLMVEHRGKMFRCVL